MNDHRELGRSMDLFHLQDEAPGAVFWHPRGWRLFQALQSTLRWWNEKEGLQEVRTPQVVAETLWERSGHWRYNEPKFFRIQGPAPVLAVKPVSCPAHLELVRRLAPEPDDLPIRLGEFGLCHEAWPGGETDGLFRLIQFTVDDGHVVCREDQVEAELERELHSFLAFYRCFGFGQVQAHLGTRPAHRLEDDARWDWAETILGRAIHGVGLTAQIEPGKGAFNGPRLDFLLPDGRGRYWMCGTLQLDPFLPEQFNLRCGGRDRPPVLLHRALAGSLERFLALVLERPGAPFPNLEAGLSWLAGLGPRPA